MDKLNEDYESLTGEDRLKVREAILVLGMHRSGTSALTGVLAHLGVRAPNSLMAADQWNRKGYWESERLRFLNDRILTELGRSWRDLESGEVICASEALDEACFDRLGRAIEDEYDRADLFVIKDPRICRLAPLWIDCLSGMGVDAKAVLPLRNPFDVAASLVRRDGMSVDMALLLWLRHTLDAEYASRGLLRSFQRYDALLSDWRSVMRAISVDLDIEWPGWSDAADARADEFISSGLSHVSATEELAAPDATIVEWVNGVQNSLAILADGQGSALSSAYDALDFIRLEFNKTTSVLTSFVARYEDQEREAQQQIVDLRQRDESASRSLDEANRNNRLLVSSLKTLQTELAETRARQEGVAQSQKRSVTSHDVMNADSRRRSLKSRISADLFFPGKRRRRLLREKQEAAATFIRECGVFDDEWYCAQYPDVSVGRADPLIHYLTIGAGEGRNPNPYFDTEWYLQRYPDVESAGVNPLLHFAREGVWEGRDPGPKFSSTGYLNRHPELAASLTNPLGHFLATRQQQKLIHRRASAELPKKKPVKRFDRVTSQDIAWSPRTEMLELVSRLVGEDLEQIPKELIAHAKRAVEESPLRISVIMPTWNRRSVVCRAVESALSQSFLPHEIIIADDGSTDRTCEKLQECFPSEIKSGRIKIVRCDHRGVSAARNAAMAVAQGEIFAYLDSDNVWREHYLLLTAALFAESDEISTVYCALKAHEIGTGVERVRAVSFDRGKLLTENFIDLNVFSHRRLLYDLYGGFDEDMTRLVDWDLIQRYTKNYHPAFLPLVGVDYFLDKLELRNITFTESLEENHSKVMVRTLQERIQRGQDYLRLAYFVYDFPALSQTFVLAELEWLVEQGYDVVVYYAVSPDREATLDFSVPSFKVETAEELADLLTLHERNLCHTHFAYPGLPVFVRPACVKASVRYTFMPHAVDIFHHDNRQRNQVGDVARDPLCLRVFVYGDYHKEFLVSMGVPPEKISYTFQAVRTDVT